MVFVVFVIFEVTPRVLGMYSILSTVLANMPAGIPIISSLQAASGCQVNSRENG